MDSVVEVELQHQNTTEKPFAQICQAVLRCRGVGSAISFHWFPCKDGLTEASMEDDDDGEVSSALVCGGITGQLFVRMKKMYLDVSIPTQFGITKALQIMASLDLLHSLQTSC
ncbi:hypothetical protein BG011_001973, partial [Mortierella polycephala]